MMKKMEEHEMDHNRHEHHGLIHHFMEVMMSKMDMDMEGMDYMNHMEHEKGMHHHRMDMKHKNMNNHCNEDHDNH